MIKNILTVFSGDLLAKVIGFAIIFILAKHISVESFGIYNYMIMLMGLVTIIVEPFANTYLRDHRYFQFDRFHFSFIWISVILSPVFYILVCWLVYPIKWYVFFIFAINFIVFTGGKIFLNVNESYRNYTILNILQNSGILFGIVFVLFSIKSENINSLILIAYCLSSVFLIVYLVFTIDMNRISFTIDFSFLKRIYGDSIYLVLYWSMLPIMSFAGMFFVERFVDEYELGLYAFSLRIYAVSLVGLSPMLTVLRIRQIDIAKQSEFITFFRRNVKKVFLFAFSFYSVTIIGTIILTFGFFIEYRSSIVASIILVTTSFVSYLTIPFTFLMAFRKYGIVFCLSLIALSISLTTSYFFIPIYGINAAALSNFFAHSFLNTTGAILSYKLFRYQ